MVRRGSTVRVRQRALQELHAATFLVAAICMPRDRRGRGMDVSLVSATCPSRARHPSERVIRDPRPIAANLRGSPDAARQFVLDTPGAG
jgi:hypothetical protein